MSPRPEPRRTIALSAPGVVAAASIWLLLAFGAGDALAHRASDSYLSVDLRSTPPQLRLDIALRDLELAIGIDVDDDDAITWGELRAKRTHLRSYVADRMTVARGETRCRLDDARLAVTNHGDGAYAVLEFPVACSVDGDLSLDYALMFDLDPTHRALVQVKGSAGTHARVLSPDAPRLILDADQGPDAWQVFTDFSREGVWHIWIGIDHMLFLLTLLIPAVLRREEGVWRGERAIAPVVTDVVATITAFTLAHSLTLAIAALAALELPARLVESAIAATVIVAALNNLRPLVATRRWTIAFALGLVHGLGFASVLVDLGLPDAARVVALLGFNLGVELGQIAIALLFLPLAYCWRHSAIYRHGVMATGSLAIAAIGTLWLAERGLGVTVAAL